MSSGDIELYHGALVMRMAYKLSRTSAEQWKNLSYRTKQKWLNQSVATIQELHNDKLIKL